MSPLAYVDTHMTTFTLSLTAGDMEVVGYARDTDIGLIHSPWADALHNLPFGPDGGEVTLTAEDACAVAREFERQRPMFPDLVEGSDFKKKLQAFYEAVVGERDHMKIIIRDGHIYCALCGKRVILGTLKPAVCPLCGAR